MVPFTEDGEGKAVLTNQLNRLLFENGMSESELATRTRIDQSHLNRIKNGHVAPSLVTALRIAEGLGLPVDRIFHLDGRDAVRRFDRTASQVARPLPAQRSAGRTIPATSERPNPMRRPPARHPG